MAVISKKTREELLNSARLLFAKKGFNKTTMNDIAEESNKGRRTLYTYFKSKKSIYDEILSIEIKKLNKKVENIVKKKNIPLENKLLFLIFTRFEAIKDAVKRNGTLRSSFFRDSSRVETIRKAFDKKEIDTIKNIIVQMVKADIIHKQKDNLKTAEIMHYAFRGLELPIIKGTLDFNINRMSDRELIKNIIFKGLNKKEL